MSGTNQGHASAPLFGVEFESGKKLPTGHMSLEVALASAREAETNWGWKAARITRGTEVVMEGEELRNAIDKE